MINAALAGTSWNWFLGGMFITIEASDSLTSPSEPLSALVDSCLLVCWVVRVLEVNLSLGICNLVAPIPQKDRF